MGGAVSAGEDNSDLIDHLVDHNSIKCRRIERAMRLVDRADYYAPHRKRTAYEDHAWKFENLHLSAPCIYAAVLKHLNLQPGCSFLNIGSGTGYLSTIAGLLIGSRGINHGVEIHTDVVEYAQFHLDRFMTNANALDVNDDGFSEPIFIVGNGLSIDVESFDRYDRIYCGAAVPDHHQILDLLKVGGVAVFPQDDKLYRCTRGAESIVRDAVMDVSFATLVTPAPMADAVRLPSTQPHSLKHLCRLLIRSSVKDHFRHVWAVMNKTTQDKDNKSKKVVRSKVSDKRRTRYREKKAKAQTLNQDTSQEAENDDDEDNDECWSTPDTDQEGLATSNSDSGRESGNDPRRGRRIPRAHRRDFVRRFMPLFMADGVRRPNDRDSSSSSDDDRRREEADISEPREHVENRAAASRCVGLLVQRAAQLNRLRNSQRTRERQQQTAARERSMAANDSTQQESGDDDHVAAPPSEMLPDQTGTSAAESSSLNTTNNETPSLDQTASTLDTSISHGSNADVESTTSDEDSPTKATEGNSKETSGACGGSDMKTAHVAHTDSAEESASKRPPKRMLSMTMSSSSDSESEVEDVGRLSDEPERIIPSDSSEDDEQRRAIKMQEKAMARERRVKDNERLTVYSLQYRSLINSLPLPTNLRLYVNYGRSWDDRLKNRLSDDEGENEED